jgi:hypothetical protein
MEARFFGTLRSLATVAVFLASVFSARQAHAAAGYRTTNFTVTAPTAALAKEIGDAAEVWRKQLAIEWLGKELPRWAEPCPINASVSPRLGAGGATSFIFDQGEVFGWRMNIQGSRERVLDSVLPHEVTHTIFATHFRQPLPRWADEGACTTVEHVSEVSKQERMLLDFLRAGPDHRVRSIPFDAMFAMKEYPEDVLPLYAQGHSLAVFLIGQKGKREFLNYLADGMSHGDWRKATRDHYGFDHLLALQNSWLDWVKAGRPALTPPTDGGVILAGGPGATPAAPSETAVPATFVSTPRVREPQQAIGQGPSPADSAAITPTPMPASAAYGDWDTRPVRHTMNAAP